MNNRKPSPAMPIQTDSENLFRKNFATIFILDPLTGYTYKLCNKIRCAVTSSGDDDIPMYRAIKIPPSFVRNVSNSEVALKVSKYDPGSLVSKRLKSLEVSHKNILNLDHDFIDSNNGYVAEYVLMNGSLRGLMNNFYQYGMRDDLVAIVLKEALNALNYLHEDASQYIYTLNADSVYCKLDGLDIKIGYAASLYLHYSKAHKKVHEKHLLISKICDWGCAPEVYDNYGNYSKKAEIWLIGVLGIDLLLGGIRVQSREDFLDLIQKVLTKSVVRGRGLKRKEAEQGGFNLSYSCRDFLRICLRPNYHERPTAEFLLGDQYIARSKELTYLKNSVQVAMEVRKRQRTMNA